MSAIPAREGLFTLTQPDGRSFQAMLKGDEWVHLLMTADGVPVTRDKNGFYCYACYDAEGNQFSTGHIVGIDEIPPESRTIPVRALRTRAEERRRIERPLVTIPPKTKANPEEKHVLVLLVQFADLEFTYQLEDFEELLCGNRQESALAYFNEMFKGAFHFQFDVYGILTLPRSFAYYGSNSKGNDSNCWMMIYEACKMVEGVIDFTKYDDDGDGAVDNVFVYFAGPDEAEGAGEDYIWSHQWYLQESAGAISVGGKIINSYACASELKATSSGGYTLATIGTFCHEYSHSLGLPDLYDTDYEGSGGIAEGLWVSLGLMDGGNRNNEGRTPPYYNAVERYILHLSDPAELTPGKHTLRPIHENGEYFLMRTDTEEEVYLFECRAAEKWDSYIGGKGLLIYHVNRSDREAGWSDAKTRTLTAAERWRYSEINSNPSYQCVDVIEADPEVVSYFSPAMSNRDFAAIRSQVKNVFFPCENTRLPTASSTPVFAFASGSLSPIVLTDIKFEGNAVTFNVEVDELRALPNAIVNREEVNTFQDAAIIRWTANNSAYKGHSYIRWGDGRQETMEVIPYADGKYAYTIEGLQPKTDYEVQIYFMNDGVKGNVNGEASFTTKMQYANSYPFIWLNSKVQRNDDGSFPAGAEIPLRIYSKDTPRSVEWTLDGEHIEVEAHGYYTVTRSGTLKAVITYADGTRDIITKTLTVR